MIRAPGLRAGVYTTERDGDQRSPTNWTALADELDVSHERATVRQVHGGAVIQVRSAGEHGDADGMHTDAPGLPLVVMVADCLAVIVEAEHRVGIAHAGWRGLRAGVVSALLGSMRDSGATPARAAIGPSIGPCCFEVGPEVLGAFGEHAHATTTWDTPSVDLRSVAIEQLEGIGVELIGGCTKCGEDMFSHRADATTSRMAGVVWLPHERLGRA